MKTSANLATMTVTAEMPRGLRACHGGSLRSLFRHDPRGEELSVSVLSVLIVALSAATDCMRRLPFSPDLELALPD